MPAMPQSYHQAHGPRFAFRSVLPDSPRLTEARLRPSVHHVPGSYRSEMNYGVDSEKTDPNQSSPVVGLSVDDGPQWPISAAVYTETQPGITETKRTGKEWMGSRTTPTRTSSLRSTASASSLSSSRQHGLKRSSAEPLISKEELPSPDTFTLDQVDNHKEEQPLLQPLPTINDLVEGKQSKIFVEKQPKLPVSALPVPADGPHLSELLAQLPPLTQEVIDEFRGHQLTAVVERNPKKLEPTYRHGSEPLSKRSSPGGSDRQSVSSSSIGQLLSASG